MAEQFLALSIPDSATSLSESSSSPFMADEQLHLAPASSPSKQPAPYRAPLSFPASSKLFIRGGAAQEISELPFPLRPATLHPTAPDLVEFCSISATRDPPILLNLLIQVVEKDVKTHTKGKLIAAKTPCSPFDQSSLLEVAFSLPPKSTFHRRPLYRWSVSFAGFLYNFAFNWFCFGVMRKGHGVFDDFASNKNIKVFSYNELRAATDSFCLGNKIGHGGFGTLNKVLPTASLPRLSFKLPSYSRFYSKDIGLGMGIKMEEFFEEWYTEVVSKSKLIENYPISGSFILRPRAVKIWEIMKTFFDAEIKKMNVKTTCFPMFVSLDFLLKQKDDIKDYYS